MAHIRRIPYTKPLPEGAEIFRRKGKTLARFRTKKGKPVVVPLTEDGKRVRLLSSKYYGEYVDADGRPHRIPLATDKGASTQMFARMLKREERKKAGLCDPFETQHERPLAEHLEDYRRFLEAEGNCLAYVDKTCARIRAILDGCGFVFIHDLGPEAVAEFLHRLRRDPTRPELPPGQELFTPKELAMVLGGTRPPQLARILRRERLAVQGNGKARRYPRATVEALQALVLRGIGISTSNGYLTAIKGFSRWLANDRTDRDRLAKLSRLNADTDRRHPRRELLEPELRRLLAAAGANPVSFGDLSGPDRRMLYAVAMTTGYRAKELASLSPAAFRLDADPPTARVRAGYSKNRKESEQPIPADVALALAEYLGGRPGHAVIWPGSWFADAAEMLRLDLQAADIPYRDEEGRVCDFHCLRHSFISLLQRSGAHPKVAQELARHSDIRLTMQVYTHTRLHDLAGAVEGLPSLMDSSSLKTPRPTATGTDGQVSSEGFRPG